MNSEEIRNLLNKLTKLHEAQDEHAIAPDDVSDLMTVPRIQKMPKSEVKHVYDLVNYLDQFADLDKFKNHEASYDDAFYEDIPLDLMVDIADISQEELNTIADNTPAYEGDIMVNDNAVTIFGGD